MLVVICLHWRFLDRIFPVAGYQLEAVALVVVERNKFLNRILHLFLTQKQVSCYKQ